MFLETLEETVKEDHLSTVCDDVLAIGVRRTGLSTLEEVRVVGALAQLHEDVEELHLGLLARLTVDDVDVTREDLLVPLDLHLRQTDEELDLLLGREVLLDLGLDATQQKWSEHLVQTLSDLLFVLSRLEVEPRIKVVRGVEDIW